MTPPEVRKAIIKVGAAVVFRTAAALHRVGGVQDNADEVQALLNPSASSNYSGESTSVIHADSYSDDGETQAHLQRTAQWNAWAQEHAERKSDLETIRTNLSDAPSVPLQTVCRNSAPGQSGQKLYSPNKVVKAHLVQTVHPAHTIQSQNASNHDACELSDDEGNDDVIHTRKQASDVGPDGELDTVTRYSSQPVQLRDTSVTPTSLMPAYEPSLEQHHDSARPGPSPHFQHISAMYEQQTGVVYDQQPSTVEELLGQTAFESPLRRQGALRRKSNPLFARPRIQDFREHRASW